MARTFRSTATLVLLTLTVLLGVLNAPAQAASRTVRAAGISKGAIVFKVRGVKASAVRSATVRVGRKNRRVRRAQAQEAARRGVMRIKLTQRQRRILASRIKNAQTPAARRDAIASVASSAQLVMDVLSPAPAPAPSTPSSEPCPSIPTGARYVDPNGSDDNPGTADRPWKTLEKAVATATPGSTVALRSGNYGTYGKVLYIDRNGTSDAPISFVGTPGSSATVAGSVALDANHVRICNLKFNGATGPAADRTTENPDGEQVKIYATGDDVVIANSEVSGSRWHAGIYVDHANGLRVTGNNIHDNGRFGDPAHANLDHGIYWGSGSGQVDNNTFTHNYAHAVVLYPSANGVTVRNNKMTGQGRAAVMIAENASNNSVTANTITGNVKGIEAYSLSGTGNRVAQNTVTGNRSGNLVGLSGVAGLLSSANITD